LEGEAVLDFVRSRSAKSFVHALGAAACLFLASCSTSPDGQASFALTNAATDDADAAVRGAAADTAAATTDAEGALPDQVAYLPAAKPGTPLPEAGIAAAAEADGKPVPAETGVASDRETTAPVAKAEAQPAANAKEQVLTAAPSDKPEQVMTATDPAATAPAQKKKGFLASLFSTNQAAAAPAAARVEKLATAPKAEQEPEAAPAKAEAKEEKPAPLVKLASLDATEQDALSGSVTGSYGSDALPGVRKSALFEIKRKSGLDDDSDVDLHEEDEYPAVRVASAAGMARLAPNGLLRQTDSVDVGCLKPGLVKMLRQIEGHFGRKVVVTSGYRSPSYNRRVRGAKRSQHMFCAAADIQVAGVTKWEIASYVRTLPGRGGVGTYCHTESVHVDIGPERDWNWRCRRRKA
jgi:uncharacterized protein YcbK (DUF882 family)